MAATRAELRIHGRVQGVGYRFSAYRRAVELGLSGYARNLDDGSVEAVAEGEEADVEAFIAWCRTGPRLARVTRVEVTRGATRGGLGGFLVD
jgi:acylphosphatase